MGICDNHENEINEINKNQPNPSISAESDGSGVNFTREIGSKESLDLNNYKKEKINKQMTNSVCRIINGEIAGTGFICLIPYPNIEHLLKVLITCNHVFNDIKIGNKIKLIFDKKLEKEIILDKTRKLYTNDKYDITIIELKDNEFDLNNYLKIDDDELYANEEFNENDQIYIIHYSKGIEVKYSIGPIISKDEKIIKYKCETEEGSSGAPIFNLNNLNVIGIHCGYKGEYNLGRILKLPIENFNQTNNNLINNEILLTLKIENNDIGKKIYFLNNINDNNINYENENKNNLKS